MLLQTKALVLALAVEHLTSSASGFTVAPQWQHQLQHATPSSATLSSLSPRESPTVLYQSDEPSDTYRDDFRSFASGVASAVFKPDALVKNALDLLPRSLSLVGEVSSETRAAINELLLKLEASNPTPEPTLSPLLNGVWELRYAGLYASDWALPSPTRQLALFLYSGGYSPGLFALGVAQQLPFCEVGELEIAISRQQPRIEAKVPVKFGLSGLFSSSNSDSSRNDQSLEVTVKARLEVLSEVRLRETYESVVVPTFASNGLDLPDTLQYSRELFVTYVDDDLLIVRDASGVPEVLVRKEKNFSQNWGTEPSEVEDMLPPGEDELPGAD